MAAEAHALVTVDIEVEVVVEAEDDSVASHTHFSCFLSPILFAVRR
jgi:hypothetical protein